MPAEMLECPPGFPSSYPSATTATNRIHDLLLHVRRAAANRALQAWQILFGRSWRIEDDSTGKYRAAPTQLRKELLASRNAQARHDASMLCRSLVAPSIATLCSMWRHKDGGLRCTRMTTI